MAGPTELLSEDVKTLREDLHKMEISLKDEIHRGRESSSADLVKAKDSLTQDINRVNVSVEKLSSEFHILKWIMGLVLVAVVSGVLKGVWWASKINTKFDRLEASMSKVLEQTRPSVK